MRPWNFLLEQVPAILLRISRLSFSVNLCHTVLKSGLEDAHLLDVDAEIEKMATMYNMEADKLKEYMGEDEKENMKQDLAVQKAVELITESVKPRAKAKTKKEKEAEAETEAAE